MAHSSDLDLNEKDITGLGSADAVASFFTKLGYDTSDRAALTPEAIGLSGDSAKALKRIELLSEDSEQFLRVVFAQPKSLTAKVRNDLARVLGKSTIDHVLVLSPDFESLEFVFLDKRRKESKGPAGIERVQVVPKTISLDRRRPSRLDLRTLRRFTWTSRDALDQFDKLRSVFEAAAYTGEYFQNRALFSDYFLRERLREDDAWRANPSEMFSFVRDLMQDAQRRWNEKEEAVVRKELFEPLFKRLGFKTKVNRPATSDQTQPDYLLSDVNGEAVTAAFVYPWERWLDGPDANDPHTPDENPGACVVTALDEGLADWIIVTNGRQWRLYGRKAHARSTNFYEVDLVEALTASGDTDPNEAFRYWWLFFRPEAFQPTAAEEVCWLDAILQGSRDYAKRLGDRLKSRVFLEIFPHMAQGFLEDRKQRLGIKKAPTREELDEIFEATLTLLYRLLFLLYAESRDLLPIREAPYQAASLKKIKEEIAEKAGVAESEVPAALKKAYSPKETSFYDRLHRLFEVVAEGEAVLNVPKYNGGLFNVQPEDMEKREERIAQFLLDHKIPDRQLALAIDRLARDQDERTLALVFIDYKSLEVRHLGSIYEGLLEFKLKIAEEDLTTKTSKGTEKYVALSQASSRRRKEPDVVVRKGDVYLSNDKAERKASGSYYTPDDIVEYIVTNTVGPVLDEKLEALRPEFRKVRKTFDNELKKLDVPPLPDQVRKGELDARQWANLKTYQAHKDLVEKLFDLKACDPAMGSGHFLVEVVDFVTDRLVKFLNQFPINPVSIALEQTRDRILESLGEQGVTVDPASLTDINLLKRFVLKRCVYGVDLNPMAVELAKVSLWLDCFTLGAPLNFLDHHLRCGNSLIGATFQDLEEATEGRLFSLDYEPLLRAINHVLQVSRLADATSADVAQSVSQYDTARKQLTGYKVILDLLVAKHFGFPDAPGIVEEGDNIDLTNRDRFLESLHDDKERGMVRQVEEVSEQRDRRFFHWEIEFPEIFFGVVGASQQHVKHKDKIEQQAAGFDCVVGNPPYVRVQELRKSTPRIVDYLKNTYDTAFKNFDLSVVFLDRALSLCTGMASFIASNKWLSTDYGCQIRRKLVGRKAVHSIVNYDDFQLFDGATTYTAIVVVSPKPQDTFHYFDAKSGAFVEPCEITHASLPDDGSAWSLLGEDDAKILNKLQRGSTRSFKELRLRAFQGLRTSDNDVYVLSGSIPEDATHAELTSKATGKIHYLETAILKPLIAGDGIRAFSIREDDQWLIFPYAVTASSGAKLISDEDFARLYPAAWDYLKICESRLRSRERGKMDKDGWWGYVYPKNLDQFEQPKIMLPDYHDSPAAALDPVGRYYSITAYCITLRDDCGISLESMAALLNSRVMFWTLGKIGTSLQRGFVRFMPQYLDRLPIPPLTQKQDEQLADFTIRALEQGADAVESELNEFVYDIFGLSVSERKALMVPVKP